MTPILATELGDGMVNVEPVEMCLNVNEKHFLDKTKFLDCLRGGGEHNAQNIHTNALNPYSYFDWIL